LLVNDRPFFVLGVTDPVGLSLGAADPSPRFPQDFERYFVEAARLGFNTVSPELLWSTVESLDRDGHSTWDFNRLTKIKALAEAHDLKLTVEWVGSNWGGVTNSVPAYIAEDKNGAYQKILKPDGSLAQSSKWPKGLYSWTDEALIQKETAALVKLAEWIRQNDPQHTILLVEINIEFGLHPSLGIDRSYDPHSNQLYTARLYRPRAFQPGYCSSLFRGSGLGFPQHLAWFSPHHRHLGSQQGQPLLLSIRMAA